MRTISALLLAPVVLGLTVWGGGAFVTMIVAVAWLMAWEWDRLWGGSGRGLSAAITVVAATAAILLTVFGQVGVALAIVVLAGAAAWFAGRHASDGGHWASLGVIYVSVPGMALVYLRMSAEHGLAILLWLLAVVWATDIGAYFAGLAIGGPKLAPRWSPNKTWAGLLGGMLCAALAGLVAALLAGIGRFGPLAFLSAGVAVIAQLGDIAESGVKRRFNVKDSSNLIPGHGGVLDRVDGLVFAAVGVALIAAVGGGPEAVWR